MTKQTRQRGYSEDTLLDRRGIEEITRLSGRTIQRLILCGSLPRPFKVGGQNRWSRRAIMDWVCAGCPSVSAQLPHGGRNDAQ